MFQDLETMARLKKINHLRRKFTKGLTKNVGRSKRKKPSAPIKKEDVKRILVSRPNHRLGNLLLITPLLQELEAVFPHAKVDVFMKGGLGPIVLGKYKNLGEIISLPKEHFKQLPKYISCWFKLKSKKYDLVINTVGGSSSGRLSTQLARSDYKIFGDIDEKLLAENKDYLHLAKNPVLNLRDFMTDYGLGDKQKPIPILNIKLEQSEIQDARKILEELVGNTKKTIAIFTYATGDKCYLKSWWKEFYETLKKNFPSYNIVEVLPKENVSQIDFEAPTYYSKDIREICAFIANSEVFIGADSGMMHLAIASQVPTAGLFCVTDLDKYGPYGANNISIHTNEVSIPQSVEMIDQMLKNK